MRHIKKYASLVGALCFSFQSVAPETRGDKPAFRMEQQTEQDILRFYNIHTKERITVTRHRGDSISAEVNWFMRDFRQKEAAQMKPALFDLLGELKQEINRRYPKLHVEFHVISSYRSKKTNEKLRDAGGSQAKSSLHIEGAAMDIHVPGLKTSTLRDIATCLNKGGVGFYAADGFVHVDIGPVRQWPSKKYLETLKCP